MSNLEDTFYNFYGNEITEAQREEFRKNVISVLRDIKNITNEIKSFNDLLNNIKIKSDEYDESEYLDLTKSSCNGCNCISECKLTSTEKMFDELGIKNL